MKIAFLTTDNREQQGDYDNPNPQFGPAPAALIEGFRQLVPDMEIHIVSCSKKETRAPQKLAVNIWFHQLIVPKIGWGRTLFSGCILATRKLLNEIQPDLVHGQGTERNCAISAVLSGYTNIITIHGIMAEVAKHIKPKTFCSYYNMITTLEKFSLWKTYGVICNSYYTKKTIQGGARKTWLVPNSIRPDFFQPLPTPDFRKHKIVVLGSIVNYKQPLEILKMWEKISPSHPHVSLIFIGHGSSSDPYNNDFLFLLNRLSAKKQTEHIDHLTVDELVPVLDSARGMIHFPTEESFGLAVAEGLSRDLKLFASETGGIPYVTDGCDGVELFNNDAWDELETSLDAWIKNGMRTPNTSEVIRNKFSSRIVAQKHVEIYKSVIAENNE